MEVLIVYSIMVYGLTVLLVEGLGPFGILEKFRQFVKGLSQPLGEMFDCFLCTSTNIGWFVVLMEYLFDFKISPVSMELCYANELIVAICNMFFTCGVVWILRNIISLFEKKVDSYDE